MFREEDAAIEVCSASLLEYGVLRGIQSGSFSPLDRFCDNRATDQNHRHSYAGVRIVTSVVQILNFPTSVSWTENRGLHKGVRQTEGCALIRVIIFLEIVYAEDSLGSLLTD
jgi:hypothetical protein